MKKLFVILLFSAVSFTAFAQAESSPKPEKYKNEWFVGVGGGFNYSFDAYRYSTGFSGKGFGTALDIYAGKWLNRAMGVALGYQGLNTSADERYRHDYGSHPFMYFSAAAAFRPTTWLVPYVHAGYVNVSHRKYGISKGSLGGGLGLSFPIRVGSVSVVPGLRMTMFSGDILDHEDVNTKTLRYQLSATLGVAYRFGGNRQKVRVETRYVDRTVEVPVEVTRVDTVVVKQIDTVYIREVRERELDLNQAMSAVVLFDINSAELRSEAYPVLNEAALFMKENPNLSVTVEGHADITGNGRINQPLSERRARAVAGYLIRRGVDPGRVRHIGYGSTRPKASNDTEEGRRQNRRMELHFDYE